MSKLEELIEELCPSGVEYFELGKITTILRGKRLTKSQLSNDEIYPVFHGGLEPLGYYDTKNRKANTVMVINVGASAGSVGYSTVDFWSSDGCYCIEQSPLIINRYAYYALLCNENILRSKVRYAGIPTLDAKVVEKTKIPLPPLPIQEEIVRILDKFTELTAELTVELTAELTSRKKQYEYYRDSLLTFCDDVEWKTLGEVGNLVRGNGLPKTDFSDKGVGCIHYGQIYTYYGSSTDVTKSFVSEETALKLKKVTKNDIIITNTSENVEDVCKAVAWLGDNEIVTGGHATIIKHNENAKFLVYYTQTSMFFEQKRKLAGGTKVIDVSATNLAKIKIPIPPIAEQERIVAILDRFDTLVNDITQGLPAEIEARKQQYEYYRDKLLTFPVSPQSREELDI